MRKIRLGLVMAAVASLGFIYGCETVGAMGTGRMTKEDIGYIVKAGTTGRRSLPVEIESLDIDDGYTLSCRPFERWKDVWQRVAKVDPWLEENFW